MLVEKPSLMVAQSAHICIVVPRGVPTVEDVRHIHGGLEQVVKKVKRGVGVLLVVSERVSPPSGDARHEVSEMFRAMRPHLKVISAHLAGNGFVASAKRSVFTWATSHMLGKTPIRAFGDLAGAADWLYDRAAVLELDCPSSLDLQTFVQARRVT